MNSEMDKIEQAVFSAIDAYNRFHTGDQKLEKNTSTVLFSRSGFTKEGHLDSIGLVNLLVLIEEKMKSAFGPHIQIELQDMIENKENILKNLESLIKYLNLHI